MPLEFLLRIFEPEDGSADDVLTAADDVPQQLLLPLVGGVPVDRTSALSLASIKIATTRGRRRNGVAAADAR